MSEYELRELPTRGSPQSCHYPHCGLCGEERSALSVDLAPGDSDAETPHYLNCPGVSEISKTRAWSFADLRADGLSEAPGPVSAVTESGASADCVRGGCSHFPEGDQGGAEEGHESA